MYVQPLPLLQDNYAYLLNDMGSDATVVVDPSEGAPVIEALRGRRLQAIWCTHHHADHVGGVEEILAALGPVPVLGSVYDGEQGRIPGQTERLGDGHRFRLFGREVEILHVHGHTLGAIAFRIHASADGAHPGDVFTGDTMFLCGCGRLFEGTPAQMYRSLSRLAALPDATRVWCGHEYTKKNLEFAETQEPGSQAIAARLAGLATSTIPGTIGGEKATNPFLRAHLPTVAPGVADRDPLAVFTAVREARNRW